MEDSNNQECKHLREKLDMFSSTLNRISNAFGMGNGTGPQSVPRHVKCSVNAFADRANQLANQILTPETAPAASTIAIDHEVPLVICHYRRRRFWPCFSYWPTPVFINPPGRGREDRRDGKELLLRLAVGVAFVVVGALAAVAVGSAVSRMRDANRELEGDLEANIPGVDELRSKIKVYKNMTIAPETKYIKLVNKIINLKARICQRIKCSARWDLLLRVGALAGSVLAVLGATAALQPLAMVVGVATVGVFGMGMLIKELVDRRDGRDIRDANELKVSISELALA